jgi:uncharacterized protein YdcH (DUF465 family)
MRRGPPHPVPAFAGAGCAFLAALLAAAGCGAPANRDQLVKEVLAADPSFTSVIEKHQAVGARIKTHEQELALKRQKIESTITQLRSDLTAAVKNARTKTDAEKAKMAPDRERITQALALASEALRAQRAQRASLGRTISQVRKGLKSTDAGWSEQERQRQQAHLDEMLRDTARLDQEMAGLRTHLRLLKIKLLLIKF